MTKKSRWYKAQKYERSFWQNIENKKADLKWYQWRANQIKPFLEQYFFDINNIKILEIGSGPIGVLSCLSGSKKCAIEPLYDFYKINPHLIEYSDKNVLFIKGIGEELPFHDSYFDFIIINNVLDHCQNPRKVVGEIIRVLRNHGGIVYFSINIRTSFGKKIRRIIEYLQIDQGHPYSFTKKDILNLFSEFKLENQTFENENLIPLHTKKIIKFALGIQENKYSFFARKNKV